MERVTLCWLYCCVLQRSREPHRRRGVYRMHRQFNGDLGELTSLPIRGVEKSICCRLWRIIFDRGAYLVVYPDYDGDACDTDTTGMWSYKSINECMQLP